MAGATVDVVAYVAQDWVRRGLAILAEEAQVKTIKKKAGAVLASMTAALLMLSGVAYAATDMLGADGTTTTGYSTCPTTPLSTCSTGGWFRVDGLVTVGIHVWAATGTASATTVKLWGRLDSSDAPYLLKTWTNPGSGEIAVGVDGLGDVRLEVVANDVTLKAKICATSAGGSKRW